MNGRGGDAHLEDRVFVFLISLSLNLFSKLDDWFKVDVGFLVLRITPVDQHVLLGAQDHTRRRAATMLTRCDRLADAKHVP